MVTTTAPGWVTRVAGQVRQFVCGVHGHDSLLHFEQGRLSLLCSSCGYETPGWDVKSAPVVQHATVEPKGRLRIPALSIGTPRRRIA